MSCAERPSLCQWDQVYSLFSLLLGLAYLVLWSGYDFFLRVMITPLHGHSYMDAPWSPLASLLLRILTLAETSPSQLVISFQELSVGAKMFIHIDCIQQCIPDPLRIALWMLTRIGSP